MPEERELVSLNRNDELFEEEFDEMAPITNENKLEALRLVRYRTNHSSFSNTGYLFLAIVFCVMCCSSLWVKPSEFIREMAGTSQKNVIGGIGRNLKFENKKNTNEESHETLADSSQGDVEMQPIEEEPSTAISYARMMLHGKYTYLTYLLLSATSFFFWVTPNCHKLRRFTNWETRIPLNT